MVVGVWRDVVERLTPVPLAERQGFLTLPPTREAHAGAHASVAAFRQIERQPTAPASPAPSASPRGIWNAASIRTSRRASCSEPRRSRAADRDGCRRAAHRPGAHDRPHRRATWPRLLLRMRVPRTAADASRRLAFRATAATTPKATTATASSRRCRCRTRSSSASTRWRTGTRPPDRQRRIGNRMAIAATFSAAGIRFVACSVHLENRTDGAGRARQMRTLLDALDAYAGSRCRW